MTARLILLALLLAVFTTPAAFAQAPAPTSAAAPSAQAIPPSPPVMAELDALKLDRALLNAENLHFKQEALAAEIVKAKAAFEAMVRELQRPGFVLQRTADGAFVYVAEKPEGEKK